MNGKLLAHLAPVGWELISFNGDYVWPSEPLKQRVQPYEICTLRFPRCRLKKYHLEQIL